MTFHGQKTQGVFRGITMVVVCLFLFNELSFGLAPNSRFRPVYRIEKADDGTHKVVVDTEAEREGRNFKNLATFQYVSSFIGQYLHLEISQHSLIPDIREHLSPEELDAGRFSNDPILAGVDIEGIRYSPEEKVYRLPVYREGKLAFYYKYYLDGNEETADITIPLWNRADGIVNVFVDIEVADEPENDGTSDGKGTALVLGASGFVGRKLCRDLEDVGWDVYGGDIEPLDGVEPVDVTDAVALRAFIERYNPDTIVYSPAVRVLAAETEPEKVEGVFVDPLRTIKECFDGRLIYVSSNQVFKGDDPPYGVDSEAEPKNAYGRAKLKAEEYVRENFPDHIILRPGYISGHNGFALDHLARVVVQKLQDGEVIRLDDTHIRRPVSVDDVTRFIVENAVGETRGVFQINGLTPVTKYRWAVRIAELSGYDPEFIAEHIIPTSGEEPHSPHDAGMVNSYDPEAEFWPDLERSMEVRQILEDLGSDNWVKRRDAAEAVGKKNIRSAEPLLIGLLEEEKFQVVRAAAAGLADLGSVAAVEPLIAAFDRFRDNVAAVDTLWIILAALGQTSGDDRVVLFLADSAKDKTLIFTVRVRAVDNMKYFRSRTAANALVEIFEAEESAVSTAALRVLGYVGSMEDIPRITAVTRQMNFKESEFEKNLAREGFGDNRIAMKVGFISACINMIQNRESRRVLVVGALEKGIDIRKYEEAYRRAAADPQWTSHRVLQEKKAREYWKNPDIAARYISDKTSTELMDESVVDVAEREEHPDVATILDALGTNGKPFARAAKDGIREDEDERIVRWSKDGTVLIPTFDGYAPFTLDPTRFPVGGEAVAVPGRHPLLIISQAATTSVVSLKNMFPDLELQGIPPGYLTVRLSDGEEILRPTSHIDCVFNVIPPGATSHGKPVVIVDPRYYQELLLREGTAELLKKLETFYGCDIVTIPEEEAYLNPANFMMLNEKSILMNLAPKTRDKLIEAGVLPEAIIMTDKEITALAPLGGLIGCLGGMYAEAQVPKGASDGEKGQYGDTPDEPDSGDVPSVEILEEEAKIHVSRFKDTIKLINEKWNPPADGVKRPTIVALGTSWISGYTVGEDQHTALNQLITVLRRYCADLGDDITFVAADDEDLLSDINDAKKGKKNPKVIVLASRNTVVSTEFSDMRSDRENVFLAGVDNSELPDNGGYIRLLEMLRLTMRLAFDKRVNMDGRFVSIRPDEEYPDILILTPKAVPVDFEVFKHLYEVQTYA